MKRAAVLVAAVLAGSCSKPAPETPAAAPAAPPAPVSVSTTSRVVGTVAQPSGTVVVMLEPRATTTFPPQSERPMMDQVGLTFGPEFLFVRTGEPVDFRNNDDTLHNVHVTHEETHEPQFNVAIPTGNVYPYTLKRDGFYRVGCDIHPSMSATIFAASTPYVSLADSAGGFEFEGVAPGVYVVTVYSGGKRSQKNVDIKGPVVHMTVE